MDAGFFHVVEVGQYFMTKDTGDFRQFHTVACREYTLPRDDGSSQPRGWIQGNTKIGPVLEITTSYLYGKHGIGIRIWSLRKDKSHSCFAARSKAKAKPQRREPVDVPSIIPMNERKWIDIEPGESSFSAYEISKKVINLLRHSQTVQREDDGAVQFWRIKNFHQNQFPQVIYWSDDRWKVSRRRSEKEISVLY